MNFQSITEYSSRGQYRRDMFRKHGQWICIRLHPKSDNELREKAFVWCNDLNFPWGTDRTIRRFYFASKDEALMFKLAFGGK